MIAVESLLYKIDQKLNTLSSQEHQSIPVEDALLALNEAQIKLIKQKLNINNVYNAGIDSIIKRYEDLQVFVVSYKKLATAPIPSDKLHRYTTNLSTLSPKHMIYISSYVLGSKGRCKDKPLRINLVRHADVLTLLANEHYKPSLEWEETIATISDDKLIIYTDGVFTLSDAYVSYLRYPKEIDRAGYIKLDGSASLDQDCELPAYMENELVDLAVQELAMNTQQEFATQVSNIKLQKAE